MLYYVRLTRTIRTHYCVVNYRILVNDNNNILFGYNLQVNNVIMYTVFEVNKLLIDQETSVKRK